jgi:type IV pilus assembly protein PilX
MSHRTPPRAPARRPATSRGFILIVGLFFLVILTMLSIAMFRSFGLQERIAGNTRDKQRAFEAAQSALQYGEWWLGQGNGSTGAVCAGVTNGNVMTSMRVCSNALATPTTLPWTIRTDYQPPQMAVAAGGGVVSVGGDINYQAMPGLYMSYLGLAPSGLAQLYQVTAFGYGGNANTTSVVQSTYQIKSAVKDLGGL